MRRRSAVDANDGSDMPCARRPEDAISGGPFTHEIIMGDGEGTTRTYSRAVSSASEKERASYKSVQALSISRRVEEKCRVE